MTNHSNELAPAERADPAKVAAFDSIRGLTAFVIVVIHAVLAFWPGFYFRTGLGWDDAPLVLRAIYRFPIKFFANGHILVPMFYVLSGFVLSLTFFRDGSSASLGSAARRRYPRLMIPVAFSVIAAYTLLAAGAMRNHAAIAVMNETYGLPQTVDPAAAPGTSYNWLAAYYGFEPSLGNALNEATWGAFVRVASYNLPLYTMPAELLGSFLVFAFLALFGKTRNRWALYGIAISVASAIGWVDSIHFLVGMGICDLWNANRRGPAWELSGSVALGIIAIAIFVLPWKSVSAYLIVAAAAFSPAIQSALSGRWLVLLGKLSFGLYVLHMPILCSLGCGTYLTVRRLTECSHTTAGLTAVGVFLTATVAAAWLFDRFIDAPTLKWTRRLDDVCFRDADSSIKAKNAPLPTIAKAA